MNTDDRNNALWNEVEPAAALASVHHDGVDLRRGSQVRLCPKRNADIMDLALVGKIATIEALEQDFENKIHVAVVLDDDPGKELGMGRFPGHRFFFSLDEIEPLGSPGNHSGETRHE